MEVKTEGEWLPLAPFKRTLRNRGAKVVTKEALKYYRQVVQEFAEKLADEVVRVAEYSGRVTIQKKDIQLVKDLKY